MKYIKSFESINKYYNGILYFYDDNGDNDYIQYWVFINDASDYYKECIEINSVGAIKEDSMIIGDLLEKLGVSVPFSDTSFITNHNVNEFERTNAYGASFIFNGLKNDVFLKILPKIEIPSYTEGKLDIVDVKKVRINADGTHYIFSDEEIELDEATSKYNL